MTTIEKSLPDTFQPAARYRRLALCAATKPQPAARASRPGTIKGAASKAARQILTEAAGIEIPRADFVVKVLAIYLLVLVPLNWFVFWLIGTVEWAWIAAPLIALVGAAAVIRLAQLDIGFARSRTEVAVLEVQGGYERAHLTRYTALYTSLSSSYTLAFDEPSALAVPFPSGKQDESLLSITQYTRCRVSPRQGDGADRRASLVELDRHGA